MPPPPARPSLLPLSSISHTNIIQFKIKRHDNTNSLMARSQNQTLKPLLCKENTPMKVFISWSGATSHRVAIVLRDWLPSVIQSIEPYVSSEDIDKGARWSTDIATELHASTYGLICLTPDNTTAPWINFEAGALGKSIDKARVSPFLFRIKRSEIDGPILQFQSTVFDRDDVFKLLKSINAACGQDGLEESRLEKSFGVWWPQLEKLLGEIPAEAALHDPVPPTDAPAPDMSSRVLEEILELTRNNHRLLRDPTAILPPDYLSDVLRRQLRLDEHGISVRGFDRQIHTEAIRDVIETYREVLKCLNGVRAEVGLHPAFSELIKLLRSMDDPLRFISREMGLRLPREPLSDKPEF